MENRDHDNDPTSWDKRNAVQCPCPWINNLYPDKLLNGTKFHTNKLLSFNLKSIDMMREAKKIILKTEHELKFESSERKFANE